MTSLESPSAHDVDQNGRGHEGSWLSKALGIVELPPLMGLIGLVIAFQVFSDGRYLTLPQMGAIASLTAAVAIPGVAVTLLIISGEFDLSIGAMFALAPIVLGTLLAEYQWTPWIAFLVAMVMCGLLGLTNGLLTTRLRIPSFIVTLGALFGIRGLSVIVTGGFNVNYFGEDPLLSVLGGHLWGVPAPIIWAFVLTAAVWFVLEHTSYGNWTRAAGNPTPGARALGVPVRRVKTINFVVSAALAAFGGIAQFALFRSVSVGSGDGLELTAIVAVVVGGTALFGVRGTAIGTLLGAIILAVLKTGLIVTGVPGAWFTSLVGALLVVSVAVNIGVGNLQRRFV